MHFLTYVTYIFIFIMFLIIVKQLELTVFLTQKFFFMCKYLLGYKQIKCCGF